MASLNDKALSKSILAAKRWPPLVTIATLPACVSQSPINNETASTLASPIAAAFSKVILNSSDGGGRVLF